MSSQLNEDMTIDDVTFSRRGLGKRLLLGASAMAVLLASKHADVQAAPTTPWVLGGNTPLTDGTEFLGTKNVAPLIFKTAATNNVPSERMRITPAGNVGIGTSAPSAKLQVYSTSYAIYGRHTATSGAQPGVYGLTDATAANANGVLGVVNSPAPGIDSAGVLGQNKGTNANGAGVQGTHAGSGYGVFGKSSSITGSVGVRGEGHIGVNGYGGNTGVLGTGVYGVYGEGDATGVYGRGGSYGVYANSYAGNGVYGQTSTTNNSRAGVVGISFGLNTSGIIGQADKGTLAVGVLGKSTSGFAGYFIGKLHVQGTLSKSAGSFKIDHPVEPATKYLYHSFVESPDMKNIYDGNVTLDANGEAIVEMPAWFEALNMEFRYQLTCIGGYAPVYIAEKIKGNRFKIAGGTSGMEVSWQVTGIRQDAYANANRIPVEEDKPAEERGTYLHPKEHGKPESANINAERLKKQDEKQPVVPPNQ